MAIRYSMKISNLYDCCSLKYNRRTKLVDLAENRVIVKFPIFFTIICGICPCNMSIKDDIGK